MLGVTLPNVEQIPAVRFDEAKQKVAEKYHRQIRNPYDLEPEEEALIGQYYKEECGAFCICDTLPVEKTSVLRDGRSRRSDIHSEL